MTETLEQRAVSRCADEMGRAILYFRALGGLARANSYHAVDFIRLAYWALYDQMFAHVIKVLDGREQAGLWFLVKRHVDITSDLCARANISLDDLKVIEQKLRRIRDKTHFHLDRHGVLDPKEIWKGANLTYGELERAMDASFQLLCFLFEHLRGVPYELPEYDGSDATVIAKYVDVHESPTIGNLPPLFPAIKSTASSTD